MSYARYSNDDGDVPSVDRQHQDNEAWAREQGHDLVARYQDDGWSGTLSYRPGIDALLADARGLDLVVVRDWYRIGRGRSFAYLMTRLEEDCGLKVACLTGLQDDELIQDVKGIVVGGEYVRSTRRSVITHMRGKAARGEYTGGRRLYGYRWESPTEQVPVPAEAAVVACVFQWADEGVAWAEIRRRTGWRLARLMFALKHPAYAGAYTYARHRAIKGRRKRFLPSPEQAIIRWGAHEPIVSREIWERVQDRLRMNADRRGRRNPGRQALALTPLLHCGHCGDQLHVSSMYRGSRGLTYYYRCRNGCVGPISTRGWTEALIGFLFAELLREGWVEILADELRKAYEAGRKRGGQETEIRHLASARDRLIEAIASGDDPPAALRRKLDETEKHLDALQRSRIDDRREVRPLLTTTALRRRLTHALTLLRGMVLEPGVEKAGSQLLRGLVKEVRVWRGSESAEVDLEIEGLSGCSIDSRGDPRGSIVQIARLRWILPAA